MSVSARVGSSRPGRASYLLRFDDLCETMNRGMWSRIEDALLAHDIRPIVGVIPDNRDPTLVIDPPHLGFWDQVRQWQERGWTIALHGYQHRYVTTERGFHGWNHRSEFAGLPLDQQEDKLRRALGIFAAHGVRPDAWMAPNHSFDAVTLEALARVGIRTITDGSGLFPYTDRSSFTWVPVQLWGLVPRSVGLWTVCLHHNRWSEVDFRRFVTQLERFAPRITSLPEALERYGQRRRTWLDAAFATQRRARRFVTRLGHP